MFHLSVSAQPIDSFKYNRIKIKQGHYLVSGGKAVYFNKDTVLYLRYDSEFSIEDSISIKSRYVYSKLKGRFSGNRFTRELFSMVFNVAVNGEEANSAQVESVTNPYLEYEGKTIRKVRIKHVPVFGSSIADTNYLNDESWIIRMGNRLHFDTRDYIVRKTLLFAEGGKVIPLILADNERILRNMSSIEDARIIVDKGSANGDSVDVIVIIRDIWSTGVSIDLHSRYNLDCKFINKNLGGFALYLSNSILFDSREYPALGYKGNFSDDNIGGSFIGMQINYESYFSNFLEEIKFSRPFFTNQLKWGGGVDAGKIRKLVIYQNEDTVISDLSVQYDLTDIWAGRLFNLEPKGKKQVYARQLILSGRYTYKNYRIRPLTTPDSNQLFYNYQLFLANLVFTGHRYFKSNLVYGFGKTEDIPVGQILEFSAGYEMNEFKNRPYASVLIGKADYFRNQVYYSYSLSFGGFYEPQKLGNSVLNFQINGFSPVFELYNWKFRPFFRFNYLIGINQYQNTFTNINDGEGIRGFVSDNLHGTQKLALRLEMVSFMPYSWYEFRLAFFAFTDLAAISMTAGNILNSRLYSGFGFGIRVRNENLVLKTIQIRIAWYPDVLPSMSHYNFDVGGIDNLRTMDFNGRPPSILVFE